jgi:tetratricopeptide (TPR) repeat protein
MRRWELPEWPERRTLILAGVVAVVVLLGVTGGWLWYAAQQREVSGAYAATMTRVAAARAPRASADARAAAAAELEQLIARYPSASSVGEAAYELGNLKYDAKQYPAARSAYEVALARGISGTLRTLTRAAVAHTWEAERNYAKATDGYQAVARDLGAKDFLYEETLMDLARAQELSGKKAEAAETYRRLLKDVPASRRAEDVKTRLAALAGAAR